MRSRASAASPSSATCHALLRRMLGNLACYPSLYKFLEGISVFDARRNARALFSQQVGHASQVPASIGSNAGLVPCPLHMGGCFACPSVFFLSRHVRSIVLCGIENMAEQGDDEYVRGTRFEHEDGQEEPEEEDGVEEEVDEYTIQPPKGAGRKRKSIMPPRPRARQPPPPRPSARRSELGNIVVYLVKGVRQYTCWIIPQHKVTAAEETSLTRLDGNDINDETPEAVMARALLLPIDMGVITESDRKRLVSSGYTIGKWVHYRAQAGLLEPTLVNKIFTVLDLDDES